MLQDALQGNNLMMMMMDDKPKFGRQEAPGMKGVDAMDLFIDPMSVFGSERHPALQEVLKQIDKSKQSRGELTALKGMLHKLQGMINKKKLK